MVIEGMHSVLVECISLVSIPTCITWLASHDVHFTMCICWCASAGVHWMVSILGVHSFSTCRWNFAVIAYHALRSSSPTFRFARRLSSASLVIAYQPLRSSSPTNRLAHCRLPSASLVIAYYPLRSSPTIRFGHRHLPSASLVIAYHPLHSSSPTVRFAHLNSISTFGVRQMSAS